MKSQLLIGAIASGSGKTTLTLGLLRALKNRGLKVQPFKCGPDYIDTKYHELASGEKAVNLDLFLSTEKHVKEIYSKYTLKSDVSIIEGVMGLFDGYDKMKGSSAEIAGMLNVPVVIVLNAKSMAYSAAPILYGFKHYYKKINLIGVIFNMVNSESHYRFLSDACNDVGIASLGYIPKNDELAIPSRHLGLNIDPDFLFSEFANKAASVVEKYVDIEKLLHLTKSEVAPVFLNDDTINISPSVRTAVAYDEAFNFYYNENIEYLKRRGEVTFFSPIHDNELPEVDFVYLPGGYPELYLKELSSNLSMIKSVRRFIEANGHLLAECGGMMYLSSCIVDKNGIEYPMVDIFQQKASMLNMKLKLGYRQFVYNGIPFKGHEFHYSSIDGNQESITTQYNAKKIQTDTKLLRYKNVIAGYTHIYWPEIDNLFDIFK